MTEAVIARGKIQKLADECMKNLIGSRQISSQLKDLERMSSEFQDLFADAENVISVNHAFEDWLHSLEDLANDMDYLLGDVEVEAMRRRMKEESYASISNNKKVVNFIPTAIANATHNYMFDRNTSYKIDVIRTKLEYLKREKQNQGRNFLDPICRQGHDLVDESSLVSREPDKKVLLEKLLGGNETCTTNISILSIVGMKGIGKTTLAMILFSDMNVRQHFELIAWVTVSDMHDVFSITKEIFQAISGKPGEFANRDMLQAALANILSGKLFLLVLDDFRRNLTYDEWELLRLPFDAAAPRSKVIVTTQKASVTSVMYPVQVYPLGVLSKEESLSLLALYALRQRNFDSHPTLKLVGESISKKCHGLPATLVEVGWSLRARENVEDWEELLREWNKDNGIYSLSWLSHRSMETSLVSGSSIVGRKHDKEVLLKELLGNETRTTIISVLSIVGTGGIGKTALAKLLFNDRNVKQHFELMAWVTVSGKFNVIRIGNVIFHSVSGEFRRFANQDMLQVALADYLSEKLFLLVLDDVWNLTYDEWECLQRCFVKVAPGSKIIVTARKKQPTQLASIMNPVVYHDLGALSNEEALSLLAIHALGEQNFDSHPTFRLLGEGICEKCQGLPLALKSMGKMLKTQTGVKDWERVLNREIWDWHSDSDIPFSLKLSYKDLPPHLRKLFLFCSLFPKGYMYQKEELVLLWMAERFLNQTDYNIPIESIGVASFEELQSWSVFHHSPTEESRYKLHGLLHDLAKSLAGHYFYTLDDDEMDVKENNESLEMLRHFSFVSQQFGVYSKFEALRGARRLRTFIAIAANVDDRLSFHISEKVLLELLPQLKYLRVLSLSNYSITMVPHSVGSLKHMRYLNFSKTNITGLPEQVCDLYNLQVLLLHGCEKLVSLPKSFAKLVNLRHLDINDTPMLKKLPSGIGWMTSLQFISKVIIEGSKGFKISKLKGMLELRGRISIEGLHKVKDARQAEEASLQQKKGLEDLVMKWSDVFDDSRNEVNEYEVFEKLKPHHELRGLKILFYGGTYFPSWVGDSSFSRLTQLTLRGCQNCTCLPTLGFLKSLKKLFVESMPKVENIGSDLFRSLEVLGFEDMQGWRIWSINNGDTNGSKTSFPCLFEISIVDCPELAQVSIGNMPSLRVIRIGRCSEVVLRSMVGASSSIISLKMDNINGLTPLHREVLQHLVVVEHLCITKCHTMEYLWESKSEAPKYLANLQRMEVSSCKKLASLGKTADDIGITMENLTEVSLTNCEKLQSYKCPQSIKKLVIHNCRSIKELSFPPGQNLPLILDIQRCHSLKEVWADKNSFSSVESLKMDNLLNLRSFPEECFESLTKLIMRGCDNIKTIPEKVFDNIPLCHLEIISCRNMKSFPHKLLPRLTLLKELLITNCPLMESFPCCSWPPNVSILRIGRLRKPMSTWGLQEFPDSLVNLCLLGENSGVDSFARVLDNRNNHHTTSSSTFILPSSLTILEINGFRLLGSLSEGLEHLKSLEQLVIESCPNLRDLPETLLPSLSSLKVSSSLKLQERCRSKKGDYRNLISHIPEVDV